MIKGLNNGEAYGHIYTSCLKKRKCVVFDLNIFIVYQIALHVNERFTNILYKHDCTT